MLPVDGRDGNEVEVGEAPEQIEDEIDGRVARRERNRQAVVDAIMVLVKAGEIEPAMSDVAALADVSERSIFRHFESREALLAAVIERQLEVAGSYLRVIPAEGPLADRVHALVLERARLYEEITPMRRAALRVADRSDLVASQLHTARLWFRDELETLFARELNRRSVPDRRDLLAGIDLAASWEAWNVLREHEGCSVVRARRVTARTLTRLLQAG
jgi:TetR/AcrR family transcriptional regulator, regulator of autoinduction and epiphytic fitness